MRTSLASLVLLALLACTGCTSEPVAESEPAVIVSDGSGSYAQVTANADTPETAAALFPEGSFEVVTEDEAVHALSDARMFLTRWVADGPQWRDDAEKDSVALSATIAEGAVGLLAGDLLNDGLFTLVTAGTPDGLYEGISWHYGDQPRLAGHDLMWHTASVDGEVAGPATITLTGHLSFTHSGLDGDGEPKLVSQDLSFTVELERDEEGFLISGVELEPVG